MVLVGKAGEGSASELSEEIAEGGTYSQSQQVSQNLGINRPGQKPCQLCELFSVLFTVCYFPSLFCLHPFGQRGVPA